MRELCFGEGMTKKANQTSVIIGGDFVPAGAGIAMFNAGKAEDLVGTELLEMIHAADFSVFNLEVPLTDIVNPILKCGPNLIAPAASIAGLKAINPGAFALANNHVLDQGEQGLLSTIRVLDEAYSPHFGAGNNLEEASRPYVFEKGDMRIGFYACAEHEFTIATESSSGANPFNPLESLDHIAGLKAECDYVIVLYHGGKEHYRYPSPMLQKVCRKIVDNGADLVVCQHSHCIGCKEEWAGSTIVYGQGNFLFDYSDSEFWQTSLLLRIGVGEDGLSIEYLPLRKQGIGVRLAEGGDAKSITSAFVARSKEIQEPGFVEERYAAFADGMIDGYLGAFLPGSKTLLFRVVNKISGHKLARSLTRKQRALDELNFLECEAHRELFARGLRKLVR